MNCCLKHQHIFGVFLLVEQDINILLSSNANKERFSFLFFVKNSGGISGLLAFSEPVSCGDVSVGALNWVSRLLHSGMQWAHCSVV